MRRRFHYFMIGVLVAVPFIAWVLFARDRPYQALRANFDKVHVGMSLEEIQAILGPGESTGVPEVSLDDSGKPIEIFVTYSWYLPDYPDPIGWLAAHHTTLVQVDFASKRVLTKRFIEPNYRDGLNLFFHW